MTLSKVLASMLFEDPPRGNGTKRVVRGWWLRLDCGHEISRGVTYRPAGTRRGQQTRSIEDVLPPPRSIACDACRWPEVFDGGDEFTPPEDRSRS